MQRQGSIPAWAASFGKAFWWMWSGGARIPHPALLHPDGLPLPLTNALENAGKELWLCPAEVSALLPLRRG